MFHLWHFAPEQNGDAYWRFGSWIERPVNAFGLPIYRAPPQWLPALNRKSCEQYESNQVGLDDYAGNLRDRDVGAVGYLGPKAGDRNLVEAFNAEVDLLNGANSPTERRTDFVDAAGHAHSLLPYAELPMRPLTEGERESYCSAIVGLRRDSIGGEMYLLPKTPVGRLWERMHRAEWNAAERLAVSREPFYKEN